MCTLNMTSRVLFFTMLTCAARAQTTELVSVNSNGAQGMAVNGSNGGSLSADGRYAAFASDAPDLVAGDTNDNFDIFVHDRQTGQTTRVSVDSNGVQGDGSSMEPAISADGRWVAFWSSSTNLVPGDTNNVPDEFVHDRVTGQTTRVSVDSAGGQADGVTSDQASISSDGRFIAFSSMATNLVPGDTNGVTDVFVHDRSTGQTTRVNVSSGGGQVGGTTLFPAMSGDGRYVAFLSTANNLVHGDTSLGYDVFVHDRVLGQTKRINTSYLGTQSTGAALAEGLAISADGRFVSFESVASDLVPGDTNSQADVFVNDRVTGVTKRVSIDSSGAQTNHWSNRPSLSADGRFVLFTSGATNLVPGDTNGAWDCFVHDVVTGTTVRVSVGYLGQGNSTSRSFSISANGRYAYFISSSTNLIPGGDLTLGADDSFVRDLFGFDPPAVVCSGDGGASACPCGNAGSTWNGCANSSVAAGARLVSSGVPSVSNDTLELDASNMLPSVAAMFFQGPTLVGGGTGAAFGDGLRCVGGMVIRLGTKAASNGSASYGAPAGDPPISVRGAIPAGGGTFGYQVLYRDPISFCTSATFNLTNAVSALWIP